MAEGFAAARALPVSLVEQWLLHDEGGSCFHETLNVGAAHSLTVGFFPPLFPAFLSVKALGHVARLNVLFAISKVLHFWAEDGIREPTLLDLNSASFRRS